MNELYHYGIKRKSGRYPYGSGERPYQDSERTKKIAKKVEKGQSRGKWTRTYNKASNEFNRQIQNLNSKYEGEDLGYNERTDRYEGEMGRKYVNEVSDLWKSIYMDEAKNKYTEAYELLGEEWLKNYLPLYAMYDEYV